MAYTNLPPGATLKPAPFETHVSDEQIGKFRQLLHLSELGPRLYENTTDEEYFGVTYEWMENAKKRWEGAYDWRRAEARINSFPNYTVDTKGDDGEAYTVHFVALFSDKKDAIPITFIHGWPGSFLEFLDLLDVVKSQYASAAELPYHIVVPSQPGYAFSSTGSLKKNMLMEDAADVIDKLMVGLGFGGGYFVQGGDTGSFLSRMLAAKYPACRGAHLNMCIMAPPSDVPDSAITATEKKGLGRLREFRETGNAYAREHGTRPATIGFVLSSSPLAHLAWIGEKFLTWSDVDPPLEAILDSVTLYWFTQTFPRGIYHYRRLNRDIHGGSEWHIHAPKVLGFSYFPLELGPIPRAWTEKTGNLVFYREHSDGGHFAAMEKPRELWKDVEDFIAAAVRQQQETPKL